MKKFLLSIVLVTSINYLSAQVIKQPLQPTSADMIFAGESDYFPLGVWMQNPVNATKYKDIGINLYVGLWNGLTSAKESQLKSAGMPIIVETNSYALSLSAEDSEFIKAWHSPTDEPDNPKWSTETNGWDIYVTPDSTYKMYQHIKTITNNNKPVFLGLGRGVSDIYWVGRGKDRGKWQMYVEEDDGFTKGGDIIQYDIYPANENGGMLNVVSDGISNLVDWTYPGKSLMQVIETTRYNESNETSRRPTVAEVRSENWLAIVQGARGIVYFVHVVAPSSSFDEDAVLKDPEMVAGLTVINQEITSLASVINSPNLDFATIELENLGYKGDVDFICKEKDGYKYIFATGKDFREPLAKFTVPSETKVVEVLNENRTIDVVDGKFSDLFNSYGVHLYKLHNTSLSIEEENNFSSDVNIQVFPNPSRGIFKIKSDANVKIERVDVFSSQGQLLDIHISKSVIDMTSYSKGIYLLKVYTANGISTARVSMK